MADKKSHKKLWIGIGLVVIVIIIIIIAASIPSSTVLVKAGSNYTLNAGQYYSIEFPISQQETITGSFNTSHGITFYILTPSEYDSFVTSGSVSSYFYTTGHVSFGSIDTVLPSGTYYLLFLNTNLIIPTTVVVTSNIMVTT